MTNQQQLKEDIAYVRAAAERSASVHIPAIYLIWAVLCLCGFTLVDLVGPGSAWIGVYWMIGGPVGGGLTWWLAWRAARDVGQADRREGKRWVFHFLGFFCTGLLVFGLVGTGQLTWPGVSSTWILLLALTYFLAGLHLERRMLPIGLLLGVGYLITLALPAYGFTVAGVLAATALATQAFLGARAHRAED
ncbi:MAG: hypothetical protein OXG29_08145 [Gammaproteobacteria bacterium]|nr:hypothetical protein [Gammaproteobacteria bacterium]